MKPSVKLVNFSDNRKDAWIFSRPGFDHSQIDMEAIGGMDMSLNRLCMLTFEVHSSLIFRDWLFSIRPIFPWARSSRSSPLTADNTMISSEFETVGIRSVKKVLKNIENGVPQDKAREGLPMTMSTAFTFTIDFRSCVGMLKAMSELNNRMYSIYGEQFEREMKDIPGSRENQIKSVLDRYILTNKEYQLKGIREVAGMLAGGYDMKSAMMAQFLRTSNAIVKTSLWNDIAEDGYILQGSKNQSVLHKVVFYMEKSIYFNLMSTRSHWFADWNTDMWGTIVGDFIEFMSLEEFWNFIPNGAGKKDPYHRDMISRIKLEEHNLPCPIMTENPQFIYDRIEEQGENPVVLKYKQLAENGYIKDNPQNEYRREYEYNLKNK